MSANPTTTRSDSYATVSFALAVFLLVLPVMADVAVGLMFARLYGLVALWMAACYGLVIYPWVRSIQRHCREPGVWRGNGRLIAAGVVLALHALMHVAMIVNWWMERGW
jgi:hypothetical protein